MKIDDFVIKNSPFNKCSNTHILEWKDYRVYKVWAEYNGKPTPTGQPTYVLEDAKGNFRFTEVEEAFEILKIKKNIF